MQLVHCRSHPDPQRIHVYKTHFKPEQLLCACGGKPELENISSSTSRSTPLRVPPFVPPSGLSPSPAGQEHAHVARVLTHLEVPPRSERPIVNIATATGRHAVLPSTPIGTNANNFIACMTVKPSKRGKQIPGHLNIAASTEPARFQLRD